MRSVERQPTTGLVVCVKNDGYPASLELLKLYRSLPDESLEPDDIRVIDESGEDYIYPAEYFIAADLPAQTAALLSGMMEGYRQD